MLSVLSSAAAGRARALFSMILMALVALILGVSLASVSHAQVTSPATINGGFPTGTSNLGGTTAGSNGDATLGGLGENQGVTFDFDASLEGSAVWVGGLQFNNANELQTQPTNPLVRL